jgi:hypothetical protein
MKSRNPSFIAKDQGISIRIVSHIISYHVLGTETETEAGSETGSGAAL